MTTKKQYSLLPTPQTSYAAEDFIVTNENNDAIAWLDRWPNWQNGMLFLYGLEGSGKTHLINRFKEINPSKNINIVFSKNDFNPYDLVKNSDCIVVDDADQANEESLFHIFNLVKEEQKTLLLTAKKAPNHLELKLPDLKTRLSSIVNVAIGAPSDELIKMVIVKMFSDRQLIIDKDVLSFILKNMERSFASARKIVEEIDEIALAEKRKITIPLVRELFN